VYVGPEEDHAGHRPLEQWFRYRFERFAESRSEATLAFISDGEERRRIVGTLALALGAPQDLTPLSLCSVLWNRVTWLPIDQGLHHGLCFVPQALRALGVETGDDVYLIWAEADVIERVPLSACSGSVMEWLGRHYREDLIVMDANGRWAAVSDETMRLGVTRLPRETPVHPSHRRAIWDMELAPHEAMAHARYLRALGLLAECEPVAVLDTDRFAYKHSRTADVTRRSLADEADARRWLYELGIRFDTTVRVHYPQYVVTKEIPWKLFVRYWHLFIDAADVVVTDHTVGWALCVGRDGSWVFSSHTSPRSSRG